MTQVATGQITIVDTNDGVNLSLDRLSILIATAADGSALSGSYTGANATARVMLGSVDDTANWAISMAPSAGVTGNKNGAQYTITNLSTDTGEVIFSAVRQGYPTQFVTLNLTKAKAGAQGTPGINTATLTIYQRHSSMTALSKPTLTATYDFVTKVLSNLNLGWSTTIPPADASKPYLQATTATAASTANTDDIPPNEWAAVQVFAADGTPGNSVQGPRGTVEVFTAIAGTSWSDADAVAALSAAGYGAPINKDVVHEYNTGAKFAEMRFYNGSGWTKISRIFSGDTLMPGTVYVDAVDTKGMVIRDLQGNAIIGLGAALPIEYAAPGTKNTEANYASELDWQFNNSAEGWGSSAADIVNNATFIALASTGADPNLYSPILNLSGAVADKIRMRIKRNTTGPWQGQVYYDNYSHGYSESYTKSIPDTTKLGEYVILEWDMANLSAGGADWISSTIKNLRIDLGNANNMNFHIDWISIGRYGPAASTQAVSAVKSIAASDAQAKADAAVTAAAVDAAAKVSAISVGGRNLYKKTTTFAGYFGAYLAAQLPTGLQLFGSVNNDGLFRMSGIVLANGDYTISFDLSVGSANGYSLDIDFCDGFGGGVWTVNPTTTVQHFEKTFTVSGISDFGTYNFVDFSKLSGQYYFFNNFKIEKGNKATGWSPAPEDVAADASSKAESARVAAVTVVDAGDGTHFGARNRNDPPWEYPLGVSRQFKQSVGSGTIGLPGDVEYYCTLETTKQYNDSSGGGIYQYAYCGLKTFRRKSPNPQGGVGHWEAWVQDLDRNAYTGNLNATSDITLIGRGVKVEGNTLTKVSGSAGYDADAYSKENYAQAFASATITSDSTQVFFGLNNNPEFSASWEEITFSVYIESPTVAYTGVNSSLTNQFPIGVGDVVLITYDGVNVNWYRNGTVVRTLRIDQPATTFYYDTSFAPIGASLAGCKFGPLNSSQWAAVGGTGKPEDGATKGADWNTNVANRPTSYRVVSVGNQTPTPNAVCGFYVNNSNSPVYGGSRSYTLVVISRATRQVVFAEWYDIYGSGSISGGRNAATLAQHLNNQGPDKIVVVFSADEPRNNRLDSGLGDAMYRCGASRAVYGSATKFKLNSAYVLVGIPGCGEGGAIIEQYQGDTDGSDKAWVDAGFTIDAMGNAIGGQGTNAARTVAEVTDSLSDKLSKSGNDVITGTIGLQSQFALLVGNSNDGIFIGSTGIYGRKGGYTQFSVSSNGTALFSGMLVAASGSFADLRIASGGCIASGNYYASRGYAWPEPSEGGGVFINASGMLFGNARNPNLGYFQVVADTGAIYTRNFSVVNGVVTALNANIKGELNGSVLRTSVLSMESARLLTAWSRLAPFAVADYGCVMNDYQSNKIVTLTDFVGPYQGDLNSYHTKRFASFRKDVFIKINVHGDGGWETLYIEQEYHKDGNWNLLTSANCNLVSGRGFSVMTRFTPHTGGWEQIAFRARTGQGRTLSITMEVQIFNFNESIYEGHTNSGISGSDSVSPPPPTPEPWCVDMETTRVPDGRYARDMNVHDLMACWDFADEMPGIEYAPVNKIRFGVADSLMLVTESGASIIQSKSTPMTVKQGRMVMTPDMLGEEVVVNRHGVTAWERVTELVEMGERPVVKISLNDRMFFAGTDPDATIATHNIQYKE